MKGFILSACLLILNFSLSDKSFAQGKQHSPLDNLPVYIEHLTHFGQRADWSLDGKRLLFLEKTFGDVYELDLETKQIYPKSHHYFHEGYTRALYLSNGDILLSGAKEFDSANPWVSRNEENAELWILKADGSGTPFALGEKCSEGPAVSRSKLRIAWTQNNKIYLADIVYQQDMPVIKNKRLVLDGQNMDFECHLETQNFRPPEEKEIIFSAYDYRGGEVMGVNIETGEIKNYSDMDNQYDEPEGIFPDGQFTLVESDRHKSKGQTFQGHQYIDIHKLALDGSGKYERITRFNDFEGWKATNPVVSDDGSFIAFQCARVGDTAGVGRGLLLLDIKKFEEAKKNSK